jgi:hypothetical protein
MKENWNTAKTSEARAEKKKGSKKFQMPIIPKDDYLSLAAARAVECANYNPREAILDDISIW